MEQNVEGLDNAGTSEEATVNAAAQAELASKEQAPVTEAQTVAAPVDTVKTPDNTAQTGQTAPAPKTPEVDWSKKVSDIEKQYAETRRWATQMAQERAAAKKELDSFKAQQKALEARIKEATKRPFNLEEFNRDFATRGFQAFDPYIAEKLDEVKGSYDERLNSIQEQNQQLMAAKESLEVNMLLMERRSDSEKYPDFSKLETKMAEILNAPNCPIDRNLPAEEKLEAAYNLARNHNSEEAIKAAEKAGHAKAQAELAKEAKTAVASGGKGVSTTPANLHQMDYDKLQQFVEQTYGVYDRD